MSSIDLVVLGIVLEKPQSAYDIQKDIEYHNLSRWTKISIPSIYKKVLQLKDKGYLQSEAIKGNKFAEKSVYSITDKGKEYFEELMDTYATQQVSILLDFNVVITNLNKMDKDKAQGLLSKLRTNLSEAEKTNNDYTKQYSDIPLVGRTIFEQQRLLYHSLLNWLDNFESQFSLEAKNGNEE